MFTAAILTLILLHLVFGLALGFFVLMFAVKQERWLKILGLSFGWIIIAFSILLMLFSFFTAMRYPTTCPFRPMHQTQQQRFYQPCPNCPYQPQSPAR
jgi:ABC-type arginine transport system permease subunit